MTTTTRSFAERAARALRAEADDVLNEREPNPSLFARPDSWLERRSMHPIDRLGRELDDVCTTAVDPLEIAAILEAEGATDATSREIYNVGSVFELAEELYERVPPKLEGATAASDVERRGSARDLSHGVLFALNALFFAVALQVADNTATTVALVLGLVASWAGGQATSLLWFRVEGRRGPEPARKLLRRALIVSLAFALVAGIVATLAGLPAVVTVLAIGQFTLVMGASVLVLYHKELLFFLALLPAVIAASLHALGHVVSYDALLYVVVLSIGAVIVLAAWLTRALEDGDHPLEISRDDVQGALQIALYGLSAALLLSYNAVSSLFGADHDARGFDLTVLPLVLTIGVAEWQLRSTRYRSKQIMTITNDLTRFGHITWRLFVQGFVRYWSVLILASVVLWSGLVAFQQVIPTESVILLASYAVLGGAFFLNLMLIACLRLPTALKCLGLASLVYLVVMLVPVAPVTRSLEYLALCTGLLVVLLFAARSVVRQALVHL
jgi:hypothetical protein